MILFEFEEASCCKDAICCCGICTVVVEEEEDVVDGTSTFLTSSLGEKGELLSSSRVEDGSVESASEADVSLEAGDIS